MPLQDIAIIPPWLTEARTGIVIHLDPAIFWYPEGKNRTIPWGPLGHLLNPHYLVVPAYSSCCCPTCSRYS